MHATGILVAPLRALNYPSFSTSEIIAPIGSVIPNQLLIPDTMGRNIAESLLLVLLVFREVAFEIIYLRISLVGQNMGAYPV